MISEPGRRRRALVWVGALVLAGLLPGCGDPARTWLEQVRQTSRNVDTALQDGELDRARALLVSLLEAEDWSGLARDDSQRLRQDVLFRLSWLELEAGRPTPALSWAERGLQLGERADVFTANLHLARGRALEQLERDPEAAGAYHRALLIDEELLQRALGGPGATGGQNP